MLGVLCASIGSIMGTEAIKLITGIGETLLGRLMTYDALEMEYRKLKIRKDPNGAGAITGAHRLRRVLRCGLRGGPEAVKDSTISVKQLKENDRTVTATFSSSTSASPTSTTSSRSPARR